MLRRGTLTPPARVRRSLSTGTHLTRDSGVGPGDRVAAYLPNAKGRLTQVLGLVDNGDSGDDDDSPSEVLDLLLRFGFDGARQPIEERLNGLSTDADNAIEPTFVER